MLIRRGVAVTVLSVLLVAAASVLPAADKASTGALRKPASSLATSPATVPNLSAKITVTSPAAGAGWKLGSSQTVAWNCAADVGPTVRILLQKGAATVFTLTGSVPSNQGTFGWTVPAGAFPGTDYAVAVVSNANPALNGVSGAFSLVGGIQTRVQQTPRAAKKVGANQAFPGADQIDISQPADGEEWQPGTTHAIIWEKRFGDKTGAVNITLVRGGVAPAPIATNVPLAGGTYNWLIPSGTLQVFPSTSAGGYRIQIVKTTDAKVQGASEPFFIFVPGIRVAKFAQNPKVFVLNPPGGGLSIPVSWIHAGTKGTHVTLRLQGTPFILGADVPLGPNGKGQYTVGEVPGLKDYILANGKPVSSESAVEIPANILVSVVGTSYSSNSENFTLRVLVASGPGASAPPNLGSGTPAGSGLDAAGPKPPK